MEDVRVDIAKTPHAKMSISYAGIVPIKLFPNAKIDMQINSVEFILL